MTAMRPASRVLGWLAVRALVWIVWAPAAAAVTLVRLWASRSLRDPAMSCGTCGSTIPLRGLWECRCGFTFYGAYWTRCGVCGDVPPFVECPHCGASTTNPLRW
jgi:hypothetical protein